MSTLEENQSKGGIEVERELPVSVWPEWKITEKIGEGSFGKYTRHRGQKRGILFILLLKLLPFLPAKVN